MTIWRRQRPGQPEFEPRLLLEAIAKENCLVASGFAEEEPNGQMMLDPLGAYLDGQGLHER